MPAAPLADDEIERLRELYKKLGNITHVAEQTGYDRNTVRKHVKSVGRPKPDRKPKADPLQTAEERRNRERELHRERELLRDVAGEKSFRSFVNSLFSVVKPLKAPAAPKAPKRGKGQVARYPLLHLSDFHFEEVVKSESVMGLNEYSIPIACRRAYRVVHSFLGWHRDLLTSGRFVTPELVVSLNGDFLTGTLHGLERHTDAPNVVRATVACGHLLGYILRDLAAAFPKVRVYGTVGNHGRLPDDRKVPTKDPTRSFDYLAYAFAKALTLDCKNIEWTLPESYGVTAKVGGHTCYFGHGNFIKQQLSIVGYGMRRFVSNLAANMTAAGQPLRYAFFGHFHSVNASEFAGVTTFICPSLIGTQEYGFLSSGCVSRPAQQAFVFDKDLGHISTETLYGDGKGFDGAYQLKV